jgi:hypothetical protein
VGRGVLERPPVGAALTGPGSVGAEDPRSASHRLALDHQGSPGSGHLVGGVPGQRQRRQARRATIAGRWTFEYRPLKHQADGDR